LPTSVPLLTVIAGIWKGRASMNAVQFDQIGYWSELKLKILRRYASEYSKILSKQCGFTHYYIDAFAGAGEHLSRSTGCLVPGELISKGV
jgi:hypothetical protein